MVMSFILLAFLAFVVFFVIHTIFLAYHLIRFSVYPDQGRLIAGAIAGISVLLLILSAAALFRIDWSTPFISSTGLGI